MKKILFPTDFSDNAKNALPYAIDLIKKNKGELTLLNVFEVPFMAPSNAFTTREETISIVTSELKKVALDKLNEVVVEENISEIDFACKAIDGGVQDEILEHAVKENVDLIVMGTKGESAKRGLFMGSVAKGVIQRSPCPVLAIPAEASFTAISKIVYATDLKTDETATVEYLVNFAKTYDATLVILHIDHENDLKEWSIDLLMDIVGNIKYPKIAFKEVVLNNVTEGINKYIEEHKPDMLAMTTHTTSLFNKIFHKSITKEMLLQTHIPLLAFN